MNKPAALYNTGVSLFNAHRYSEALDFFVAAYNHKQQAATGKQEILDIILETYYKPNMKELKARYESNVASLLAYRRNFIKSFPAFNELGYLCIPRSDTEFYIFNREKLSFEGMVDIAQHKFAYHKNLSEVAPVMAANLFDIQELQALHIVLNETFIYDAKVPIYLVWELEWIPVYLQLSDYRPIIATESFLFWSQSDLASLAAFLKDYQVLPRKFIGNITADLRAVISEVIKFRWQDFKVNQSKVSQIAENYTKEYYRKLFCHPEKIRILFIMRRFTPTVTESIYADDNCIYDCMNACQELGIEYALATPKEELHWLDDPRFLQKKIIDFQPHVVFEINHHKWEWQVIPDDVMQIAYVLDPVEALPHIYSSDTSRKVRWNDFFLVMTEKFEKDLVKVGYPELQLLRQPVPVNTSVYYKRSVTGTERDRYTADIVYISHVGNPEAFLRQLTDYLPREFVDFLKKEAIKAFVQTAYEITCAKIEKSKPLFRYEDYEIVIDEAAQLCGVELNPEKIQDLAYTFGFRIGNPLHRVIPLTWLAERGYSLKLWGNEWSDNKKLKDYAMGPANHAEAAKILSCSKIAMGLQHQVTMHPRALEAMACGCLYICKNLPYDYENIRNYYVENEDFVCFYSKDDLLQKVDYYLENEDERERIAENGRRKTIERYSYKTAIQNWVSFIKSRLEATG